MVYCLLFWFLFLRLRRPPRSTRTDTLVPYPPLFRAHRAGGQIGGGDRSVDDRAVRQPRAGAVAGGIDRHWQPIDLGRSAEARDEFGARGVIDVHRAADLPGAALIERLEERRVGKECVRTCRYRVAPCHKKNTIITVSSNT